MLLFIANIKIFNNKIIFIYGLGPICRLRRLENLYSGHSIMRPTKGFVKWQTLYTSKDFFILAAILTEKSRPGTDNFA